MGGGAGHVWKNQNSLLRTLLEKNLTGKTRKAENEMERCSEE